jgi:hypothetical protein
VHEFNPEEKEQGGKRTGKGMPWLYPQPAMKTKTEKESS